MSSHMHRLSQRELHQHIRRMVQNYDWNSDPLFDFECTKWYLFHYLVRKIFKDYFGVCI